MTTAPDAKVKGLVKSLQGVLATAENHIQAIDAVAWTLLTLGCKMGDISLPITQEKINYVQRRYGTSPNLADACVLEGLNMLKWCTNVKQKEQGSE